MARSTTCKGRLGIGRAQELRLASEFDYAHAGVLYLPQRMPDPRSPSSRRGGAGGRSRSCSGRAAGPSCCSPATQPARGPGASPRASSTIPCSSRANAPRSALLREFRATPNAVLLATSSFWQGVDVVGEALSCVIIDKLPFASPGDPITAARIEAIDARGRSAVRRIPDPARHPRAAAGARPADPHRQDRGVLAILDPRLRTMGYGRRFLASLPPAPVTHRIDDLEPLLRRRRR